MGVKFQDFVSILYMFRELQFKNSHSILPFFTILFEVTFPNLITLKELNDKNEYILTRISCKESRKASSEKIYVEIFCFIQFKIQNGAFQANLYEFGYRGI